MVVATSPTVRVLGSNCQEITSLGCPDRDTPEEEVVLNAGPTEPSSSRRGRPPESEEQRARRRLAISRHAVRLFVAQGVAETTGEQIAHAAGISERTLWRLFRAKEACVEPLLRTSVDDFVAALRSSPGHLDLGRHVGPAVFSLAGVASPDDFESVLAVIRLSRSEPGVRAVWLVLHERAEPAIAEALAAMFRLPAEDIRVRLRAVAVNAGLRMLVDDLAWLVGDAGVTNEAVAVYRERLATMMHTFTRLPADDRG